MQLFVSGDRYEVCPLISGYHLKTLVANNHNSDADMFMLTHSGRPLRDDVSLDVQGVREGSEIGMHATGNGGLNRYTVMFWLMLLCYAGVLFFLMGTGIFNMIGYLYAYYAKWGLDKAVNLIYEKFSDGPLRYFLGCFHAPIYFLVSMINFVLKHTMTFIFLFVALTVLGYPMLSTYYHDHCRGSYLAKKIAAISVAFYMIIYGLLNLNNLISEAMIAGLNNVALFRVTIVPFILMFRKGINFIKYYGFYFIPYTGAIIQNLHEVITEIVTSVYGDSRDLVGLSCEEDPTTVLNLLQTVDKCVKSPGTMKGQCAQFDIVEKLRQNRMEEVVSYAILGLDNNKFAAIEQQYKQSGFFTKMDIFGFTQIGRNYFCSRAARGVFCGMLATANGTNGFFDYIGSDVDSIIDTMKMGNIAGAFATFIYILATILGFIWPSLLGYL